MSTESEIEEAVVKAKEAGIAIVRGPVFIWSGRWTLADGYMDEPVLKGCDAFGAALWYHELAQPSYLHGIHKPSSSEWKKIYDILNKDSFWWHRFRFGWNQGRKLQMYTEQEGKRKYIDDDISASGVKMYKKFST